MTLWFVLIVMIAAAAAMTVAPLLRKSAARSKQASSSLGVFRDQLADIEQEVKNGALDEAEAKAMRVEIERRMLEASDVDENETSMQEGMVPRHGLIASGIVGAIVVAAVGLYVSIGNPNAAHSYSSDATAKGEKTTTTQSAAATSSKPSDHAGKIADESSAGSIDKLTRQLAERLKKEPNDSNGWQMLGWSYYGTGRYAQAADAYQKAVELTPNMVGLKSSLGEALVRVSSGWVTPRSLELFKDALKLDPKDPRARYFTGVERHQARDRKGALKIWQAMLKDSTDKDSWAAELKIRVAKLSQQIEQGGGATVASASAADASGKKPVSGGTASAKQGGAAFHGKEIPQKMAANKHAGGPTPDQVRASQTMSTSDRSAMIKGMVDGLAKRLEASPRDSSGWIKLMRSRVVLGEKSTAKSAYAKAMDTFSDSPAEQEKIKAAAKQFGIE